jgi:AbrB family looped-hinge helix DNA binding protein
VAPFLLCHVNRSVISSVKFPTLEGAPMSTTHDVRVAENGRMVLPRAVRDALGLQGPAKLVITVEGDEVRLTPVRHGALRAQALYRRHATARSTVDDFLAERRREAEADDPATPERDPDA